MSAIEFHGLTKRYGSVTAVDDLPFSPADGRVTGFVGANGAGKSTTMRLLLGLARPHAGTATVNGRPYAELAPCRHRVVLHVVPADLGAALARHQEAGDHAHGRGLAGAVRPQEAQHFTRLGAERHAVHGEQPSVALAQADGFDHPDA
jgi:ABC-2 type transport system ATP-binding protein